MAALYDLTHGTPFAASPILNTGVIKLMLSSVTRTIFLFLIANA